jgi:predicted transcriptional regulator of viral defense system
MDKKLKKGEYLEVLLRSPRTVFSVKDVALLWGEEREQRIALRLNKYARAGKLIRLRRGIYAKDEKYDRFELANRIYAPSYISFETILTRTGINFQGYKSIFVASYITRRIEVGGQKIYFIHIKDYVLTNTVGIEHQNGVAIATKERAFLDRIYVSKDYHFDNLNVLDWDKVFQILPIYNNKKMFKIVNNYFKHYKDSNI